MTIRDLTPKAMRCGPRNCPSVHELEDGRLLVVGTAATDRQTNECGAYADEEKCEVAIIIDRALLADVPPQWRTIDSAPRDKTIMLWWRPRSPNPHAEAWVIGQVSSHEEGKWWNGQRGEYQDISHVTHWLPLPLPPTEREGACSTTQNLEGETA